MSKNKFFSISLKVAGSFPIIQVWDVSHILVTVPSIRYIYINGYCYCYGYIYSVVGVTILKWPNISGFMYVGFSTMICIDDFM